ncbi:MAG: hypothetical protein ACFE9V_18570, partial [Candidatus Hodarchaeota archaeon]
HRKAQWLEFENESILQFLAKYKIVNKRQESASGIPPDKKINDYVDTENQPGIIVDVIKV